jgi:hypothetical protein
MPEDHVSPITVQPVRKERPNIRALARVLIELAKAESSEPAGTSQAPQVAVTDTPAPDVEPAA